MPFSSYRRQFPFTVNRKYLNHASISPLSQDVREKMDWYINNRSFGEIEFFEDIEEILIQTRKMLADLINGSATNIALTSSATEGLNHLAQGYNWKKGDQIIFADIEYPANVYPFKNLEKIGVELVFARAKKGSLKVGDIENKITPKTKMIFCSFVEFISGYKNDLLEMGAICKKNKVLFCVDASQGLGAMPLDVSACHIDFLTCSGHKWLMAPMGVGFMYVNPSLFEKLNPVFIGYKSVQNDPYDLKYKMDLLPDARRFEYATKNYLGICGLWASLEILTKLGLPAIEQHLNILGKQLVDRLQDFDLKFLGSDDSFYWSGIFSFGCADAEELYIYLSKNKVICSVIHGNLRFSPHFYNNREDINETIEIITKWYINRKR